MIFAAEVNTRSWPICDARGECAVRAITRRKPRITEGIKDTVSISERPAAVEDRAVLGHWEGDLLCGSGSTQIATLVERQSRYVMLLKTPSKDTEAVINALIKNARKLPQELYKSLTWDRGTEMTYHKRFTLATDIQVYFCDPQNPWQRQALNQDCVLAVRPVLPSHGDQPPQPIGFSISSFHAGASRLGAAAHDQTRSSRISGRYLIPSFAFLS